MTRVVPESARLSVVRIRTAVDQHPSRTGRDTRAEILAVAIELFSEQGYEATSLREIAERLGITKAALYYHFPGKDDILRALLEPMGDVIVELVERLEAARHVSEWADALSWIVGMIEGPADEIQRELRAAVRAVLGVGSA